MKDNLNIVIIGGGTGTSVMLYGLKNLTDNLTAIVTVADDGGGSGYLREDLGMLPPGDIRACLIALSDQESEMEKLMRYRFDGEAGRLAGQSFGNLFLAALNGIYGDFEKGLKEASNVLAIKGKVLPMTLENVVLFAELENGDVIEGESNIPGIVKEKKSRIEKVFLKPALSRPPMESLEAIAKADVILLGPGSLYTSLMPNLLVEDLSYAVKNSKAKKAYICNCMTQAGETDNYSVLDHYRAIEKVVGEGFLDYIIVNDKEVPQDIKDKYLQKDGTKPVILTEDEKEVFENLNVQIIKGDFLEIKHQYVRHDSEAVCKQIEKLARK